MLSIIITFFGELASSEEADVAKNSSKKAKIVESMVTQYKPLQGLLH